MTKTKNCQLNQWEASDPIRREDFNADNAAIDAALAAAGNCKIVTGSYEGTGTYGSANPKIITFDAKPLVVLVIGAGKQFSTIRGCSQALLLRSDSSSPGTLTLAWSDQGLSWYGDNASVQLNAAAIHYNYIAFLLTTE